MTQRCAIGNLCVKCLCVSEIGGQVEVAREDSFVASLISAVATACMKMVSFGLQVMPATKLRISLGLIPFKS